MKTNNEDIKPATESASNRWTAAKLCAQCLASL